MSLMNSSMDRNNLTIVLPCHNEQDTVLKTILELNKNLNPLLEDYKIFYLFVDDILASPWCEIG